MKKDNGKKPSVKKLTVCCVASLLLMIALELTALLILQRESVAYNVLMYAAVAFGLTAAVLFERIGTKAELYPNPLLRLL